jgi:CTP:phosphocholine cytidylyltransferase-like protein
LRKLGITKDEGILKTIEFLKKYEKPFFEICIVDNYSKEDFQYWIKSNNISIINIAGPRESNDARIYNRSFELLKNLFD